MCVCSRQSIHHRIMNIRNSRGFKLVGSGVEIPEHPLEIKLRLYLPKTIVAKLYTQTFSQGVVTLIV